jgi:hypothetical protein
MQTITHVYVNGVPVRLDHVMTSSDQEFWDATVANTTRRFTTAQATEDWITQSVEQHKHNIKRSAA